MIPDYTSACRLGSLRGARIGVPWNVIALELESNANEPERAALAEEIRAFHESLKVMKTFGTTIIDAEFSMARELKNSPHEARICLADYIVNLPSYLDKLSYNPADVHTLNDVRNWTKSHGCIEDYPRRNTYIWDMALGETGELPYNNTDPKFWEAYQELQHLGGPGGLLGALDRHRLSAVILPTSIAARYAAVVGAPVITVPLGYYSDNMQLDTRFGTVLSGPGIPFGLSFLGKPWGERDLIGLAFDFEQRTMVRRKGKPLIRPRAEISTCT
jgi:amidase